MTDRKISELVAVTSVDDADEFVLARSGSSNKITGANMGLGGSILTATKQLENADIIALGTEVPFTVLTAPTVGKFYNLISGLVSIDAAAAPYGNIDASVAIGLTAGGASFGGGSNAQITALLGGDGVAAWMPIVPGPTYGDAGGDESLALSVYNNGAGPFNGGDAANSGYVKVWYTLEDFPS